VDPSALSKKRSCKFGSFFYPPRAIKGKTYDAVIGVAVMNLFFWLVEITVMGVLCAKVYGDIHSQSGNDITVLLPAAIFNMTIDTMLLIISIWCFGAYN
jgi:hypothetical protein